MSYLIKQKGKERYYKRCGKTGVTRKLVDISNATRFQTKEQANQIMQIIHAELAPTGIAPNYEIITYTNSEDKDENNL